MDNPNQRLIRMPSALAICASLSKNPATVRISP